MFLSYLQTDEHFTFLNLKIWILVIFKAALASQRRLSCPYKPLSFQTLRHPQFLSNFQSPKFKFSVSGKKNVRLFEVMTKTSVSSDKNIPLGTALMMVFCPVDTSKLKSANILSWCLIIVDMVGSKGTSHWLDLDVHSGNFVCLFKRKW